MMSKRFRAAIVAIAASALSALAPTTALADLSSILSRGTINIGVPESFPPFGSLGPDGEYVGYDVDVAQLIAKDLGVELNLIPLASNQRIPFLETQQVDLVVASLGANPERAKSIWFSNAYAPFYSGAFAATGKAITSVADLSGLKVGLTGGTLEDLALTEAAPTDAEIVRFGDNAATLAAYVAGQIDVLVTGNTVAAQLAADNPGLEVERKFILRDSPCFIGVRKGDIDLLRWVNVFILHKQLNGDLEALSQKHFGQPLPPLPTL